MYSTLSAKDALKTAVSKESVELEELSNEVREILTKVLRNQEQAKAELEESFAYLALQESSIDFEGPLKIKEDVLKSLQSISMFLVNNVGDLQEQDPVQGRLNVHQEGNLEAILQLTSNPLNKTSTEFNEKLHTQLKTFRKVISKFDLGDIQQERKWVTELELLDEQDIEQAKHFLQALVEGKKLNERVENASAMKVEGIMKLLENKSNYASEEMIA